MATDLRAFGVEGDGKTDDTAALQHAIEETAGQIHLPPGQYRITKGLVVNLAKRGKTEIRGPGARIINEGNGPAILFLGTHAKSADPKGVTAEVWARESTPLISGIEIAGAAPEADGIALNMTWQPTITHVTIHDCRHGIHIFNTNRNIIISNSHIYHNRGVGIFYDDVNVHQSIINTSHISYNAGGGIKVLKGNIRNIQIVGNDIEYNFGEDGVPVGDVWFLAGPIGIREGTIAGNTIQAKRTADGANVRIEGIGPECNYKAGLIAITGNLITNQNCNILLRHARNIAITGNTMLLGPDRNIRAVNCDQIAIGSNVIDDIPDYGGSTVGGVELDGCTGSSINGLVLQNARHGIQLRRCSEINVTGCIVKEPQGCGVELIDTANSRVSDCIVTDKRGKRAMTVAIHESGKCSRNMILHNRADGGTIEPSGEGTVCDGNLVT
ncbi:MAG: right-handed parallel beta-helix repeat-containing protein [Planctomycetota bacterium]